MAAKKPLISPTSEHFSHRLSDYVAAIIKELSNLQSVGVRPSEIFDDWLACCYHALKQMPAHAEAIAATGTIAIDPPEIQAHFSRINERYCVPHKENWDFIHRAFALLLDSVHPNIDQFDALGDVYMLFAYPNTQNGQFFTPWSVCSIMAHGAIGTKKDGEKMVFDHILKTLREADGGDVWKLYAESALLSAQVLPEDDPETAQAFFLHHVVTAVTNLKNWKPLGVNDPAIGSGRCLIAGSQRFPEWANRMGIVQYYGNDIDYTCVQMAEINMMLHGLNLHWLRSIRPIIHMLPEVSQADPEVSTPTLQAEEYVQPASTEDYVQAVSTAVEQGDREAAAELAKAWRDEVASEAANSGNIYQLNIFGEGMTQVKKRGKK